MLTVNSDTIRLFLHITAATIWVGGQLTLAALIPALRAAGTDIPAVAARAFRRVAWPAFGITILTGIWSVSAESDANHGAYSHTLILKLVLVAVSGVAAGVQALSRSKGQNAALGALAALSALGAMFAGVMLAG